MFKLTNNLYQRGLVNLYARSFSNIQYDLCVIGGGPGGNYQCKTHQDLKFFFQDMLLL